MKKIIFHILFSILAITTKAYGDANVTVIPSQICSPTECYQVIKKLGEGAFGEVFEVKNSKDELFAIKTYKSLNSNFASIYSDAEREFMRGQILNHPNIIKSHELFESANHETKYLVLQLVKGETLFETNKGALEHASTLCEALRLCETLKYAFTEGFIHNDLHANNLMVDREKHIMVIDLASFVSLDEVIDFWEKRNDQQRTNLEKIDQPLTSKVKTPLPKTQKSKIKTKNKIKDKAFTESEKIQQFFVKNPDLVKHLKKSHLKYLSEQKSHQYDKKVKTTKNEIIDNNFDKAAYHDYLKKILSYYYFDNINEMCSLIIAKSALNRSDKYNLKAKIKKISWHYGEDLEESCDLPVEIYLERLNDLLQLQWAQASWSKVKFIK